MQTASVREREGVLARSILLRQNSRHTANVEIEDIPSGRAGYALVDRYVVAKKEPAGAIYQIYLDSGTVALGAARGFGEDVNVAPVTVSPGWLDEVTVNLEKLTNLEDNWNGNGGNPVSKEYAGEAVKFLRFAADSRLPKPFIYPAPDGGAIMNFERKNRSLALMLEDGKIYSILRIDDTTARFDGELGEAARDRVLELLRVVFAQFKG